VFVRSSYQQAVHSTIHWAVDASQQGNGTMIAGQALGIVIATIAFGSTLISWRRYGALVAAAPNTLAACPKVLELRYRIIELGRSDDGDTGTGNVVSLPVRPRLAPLHPALRAAA
jgi:hypothetical protein